MDISLSLEEKYTQLVKKLSDQFADGDIMKIEAILYLIGVQEFGKGFLPFSKDDKINLMHIAVCKIFEPYGYYRLSNTDSDGWPHYETLIPLPSLALNEQTNLMKEAVVKYFENN
ncbi:MAG: hypothetical protein NDI80_09705 [Flavobacteriaceae bacterium]|nr:hypothetical protein [Flavobacteriaceae bacterium]